MVRMDRLLMVYQECLCAYKNSLVDGELSGVENIKLMRKYILLFCFDFNFVLNTLFAH